MSKVQHLDELRAAYAAARARLIERMNASYGCTECRKPYRVYSDPDCPHEPNPDTLLDAHGRFLLLDALTVIVLAETAELHAASTLPPSDVMAYKVDGRLVRGWTGHWTEQWTGQAPEEERNRERRDGD